MVCVSAVLAPFAHIAVHVVETPRVRRIAPDAGGAVRSVGRAVLWRGVRAVAVVDVAAVSLVAPDEVERGVHHLVRVRDAAAVAELGFASGAARELPLPLRGQVQVKPKTGVDAQLPDAAQCIYPIRQIPYISR